MDYVSRLDAELIKQHVEQSHALWGAGRSTADRFAQLYRQLAGAPPNEFMMSGFVENGKLVASCKRYGLHLTLAGKIVSAVGFGAVFTETAQRGRGLAPKLLDAVTRECAAEMQIEAALLYSDIGPEFYARLGFLPTPALDWKVAAAELPEETSPLTVTLLEDRDVENALHLYHERTREYAIRTIRTRDSWARFHWVNHVEADYALKDGGGNLVGYFSATRNRDVGYGFIEEFLAAGPFESAAWAALRRWGTEQNLSELRGWQWPGLILPGSAVVTPRPHALPMLKFIHGAPISGEIRANAYFAPADHF